MSKDTRRRTRGKVEEGEDGKQLVSEGYGEYIFYKNCRPSVRKLHDMMMVKHKQQMAEMWQLLLKVQCHVSG